jgi:hypothetical protein
VRERTAVMEFGAKIVTHERGQITVTVIDDSSANVVEEIISSLLPDDEIIVMIAYTRRILLPL